MPRSPDAPKTTRKPTRPERRSASLAHQFGNSLLGVKVLLEDFRERAVLSSEDTELLNIAIAECSRMQSMVAAMQTCLPGEDADTLQAADRE